MKLNMDRKWSFYFNNLNNQFILPQGNGAMKSRYHRNKLTDKEIKKKNQM